ncbi:bifunctional folylpolyglutamate synthase/dihydrofolate synthase [Aquirufa sp. ROCK-SH2]
MNYKEVIAFLYSQLPVFHREGKKAYKPGLDNIQALCELFGNPQNDLKCLHIAGTNGKGSTSHFMASILHEAGYKVGLYTSPHLKSFTERIKINGVEIDENWIINFVTKNQEHIKNLHASFFEWTVIMAFCYFKEQKIDWAIIETGLGGRLDSTNVINPVASLITNISWDHQDVLGDTLEQIAAEKAGIIKSNAPVTISENQLETKNIFLLKSQKVQTEIQFAEDSIELKDVEVVDSTQKLILQFQTNLWSAIFIESPYLGKYQIKNIRGILAWCEQLISKQLINLNIQQIQSGIKNARENTKLKGRWEILHENPSMIADTAHNLSGLSELMDQISSKNFDQLYIILGMVADKDIEKVLSILPKTAKYIFSEANNPRALRAGELQQLAEKANLIGEVCSDVNKAMSKILKIADKNDFILITGSTYLVAEIDNL